MRRTNCRDNSGATAALNGDNFEEVEERERERDMQTVSRYI